MIGLRTARRLLAIGRWRIHRSIGFYTDEADEKIPRFGFQQNTYEEYLTAKEELIKMKEYYMAELPTLHPRKILHVITSYSAYHLMDRHIFSACERALLNTMNDLDDNSFINMVEILCQQAPLYRFSDFRFIERRIETSQEVINRYNFREWLNMLCLVATSGQNTSPQFSNMVWESYQPVLKHLDESDKLHLLKTVVLTNQGKPDEIPSELLSKLSNIQTTQEFVVSVPIINYLNTHLMEELIPHEYKTKVIRFSEVPNVGSVTLQKNVIEILGALKIGQVNNSIRKLVEFVQENFKTMSYSELAKAFDTMIKSAKMHPTALNQCLNNFTELQNELAEYIVKNAESASLIELLTLGRILCEMSVILRVENPEHRKALLAILTECLELLQEDKSPTGFLSYVMFINQILDTQYAAYFQKGTEIQDNIAQLINIVSVTKLSESGYLALLAEFRRVLQNTSKSNAIEPSKQGKLAGDLAGKIDTIKLESFDSFVAYMTELDQLIELIGAPHSRQVMLVKEKVLEKYQPAGKR